MGDLRFEILNCRDIVTGTDFIHLGLKFDNGGEVLKNRTNHGYEIEH